MNNRVMGTVAYRRSRPPLLGRWKGPWGALHFAPSGSVQVRAAVARYSHGDGWLKVQFPQGREESWQFTLRYDENGAPSLELSGGRMGKGHVFEAVAPTVEQHFGAADP